MTPEQRAEQRTAIEQAAPDLLEALTMLMQEPLGDFIYDIRSSESESGEWDGPSWEGPRVTNWSEAVTKATTVLARLKARYDH